MGTIVYEPTYIYNQTTQTVETRQSIWLQIADVLTYIGGAFIAFGRLLIQIGQFIYEVFFR